VSRIHRQSKKSNPDLKNLDLKEGLKEGCE
jgi:hypothetical protein